MKNSKKATKVFVDSLQLYIRGGAGGQGLPSMGGHGGRGSNMIAVCRENASLGKLKHDLPSMRVIGKPGDRSHKFCLKGKDSPNMLLYVPPGVTIRDDKGEVIGELNRPDDQVILAQGGHGGNPNNGFAGKRGQAKIVTLDLRLVADVGLVGFPNAGKSSLLSRLSRARPRIASYPFTTLRPQLGSLRYNDLRQISVADLPGIVEGASENKGLGHSFLKHIERTNLLLFVVGLDGFQLSPDLPFRSEFETVVLLNEELRKYNPSLLSKGSLLVVNKMDLPGAESKFERLKDSLLEWAQSCPGETPSFLGNKSRDVLGVSCASGHGIEALQERIRSKLDEIDDQKRAEASATKRELELDSKIEAEKQTRDLV